MTELDELIESTEKKRKNQKKKKMGNQTKVWRKDALRRHTIYVSDEEDD